MQYILMDNGYLIFDCIHIQALPFHKQKTTKTNFYNQNGEATEVDMMHNDGLYEIGNFFFSLIWQSI